MWTRYSVLTLPQSGRAQQASLLRERNVRRKFSAMDFHGKWWSTCGLISQAARVIRADPKVALLVAMWSIDRGTQRLTVMCSSTWQSDPDVPGAPDRAVPTKNDGSQAPSWWCRKRCSKHISSLALCQISRCWLRPSSESDASSQTAWAGSEKVWSRGRSTPISAHEHVPSCKYVVRRMFNLQDATMRQAFSLMNTFASLRTQPWSRLTEYIQFSMMEYRYRLKALSTGCQIVCWDVFFAIASPWSVHCARSSTASNDVNELAQSFRCTPPPWSCMRTLIRCGLPCLSSMAFVRERESRASDATVWLQWTRRNILKYPFSRSLHQRARGLVCRLAFRLFALCWPLKNILPGHMKNFRGQVKSCGN